MVSAGEKTIFVLMVGVFILQQRVNFVGFPCLKRHKLKVSHGGDKAGFDRRGPCQHFKKCRLFSA